MKPNLPFYKLVLDENPDSSLGVATISLVSDPAIMVDFITFSKEEKRFKFQIQNEDRRLVSGPALIPELPIYRRDEDGNEYYVSIDKATIEQVVEKFFKEQRLNNIDLEHSGLLEGGVTMIESFIVDTSRGNIAPANFSDLPDGSWLVTYKVSNDDIWDGIKEGTFKGFSISGLFEYLKVSFTKHKDEYSEIISNLDDAIKNIESVMMLKIPTNG